MFFTMARVKPTKQKTNNGANVGYEAQLWQMADALRGSMDAGADKQGRTARVAEELNRFIWQAVRGQGYRGAEVAGFLRCHPSNISRALQKGINS